MIMLLLLQSSPYEGKQASRQSAYQDDTLHTPAGGLKHRDWGVAVPSVRSADRVDATSNTIRGGATNPRQVISSLSQRPELTGIDVLVRAFAAVTLLTFLCDEQKCQPRWPT